MYPRTNYEMTEDDLQELLAAMKSVPVIMIGSYSPASPQENANAAWARLGAKMGFDYMTVQPIHGKGSRFFSAIPNETEETRVERLARESEEERQTNIAKLRDEIDQRQKALDALVTQGDGQ